MIASPSPGSGPAERSARPRTVRSHACSNRSPAVGDRRCRSSAERPDLREPGDPFRDPVVAKVPLGRDLQFDHRSDAAVACPLPVDDRRVAADDAAASSLLIRSLVSCSLSSAITARSLTGVRQFSSSSWRRIRSFSSMVSPEHCSYRLISSSFSLWSSSLGSRVMTSSILLVVASNHISFVRP